MLAGNDAATRVHTIQRAVYASPGGAASNRPTVTIGPGVSDTCLGNDC